MIIHPAYLSFLQAFKAGNLPPSRFVRNCIDSLCKAHRDVILSALADVLPFALSVAGAILVVSLGWRLFRSFTKG